MDDIISCLPSPHSIEDRILFILKVNVVRGRYDLWDPECVKGVPQKSFRNIEDIGEEEDISWFCRTARLKYKDYDKDYHTIYEYLYGISNIDTCNKILIHKISLVRKMKR